MSAPRTVQVVDPVDGSRFAIQGSPDDFGVIGAIERSEGHYEFNVLTALGRLLAEDSVCLDIGANIGVLTTFMARHCPAGRVFAFEPSADNLHHLTANLERNQATNVTVCPIGLYDKTGTLSLNYTADHPGGSFITDTAIVDGANETIEVQSLDDWAEHQRLERLDVVKLDVEGSELRVLRGGEGTLRRFRPVLVVECNPIPLRRFQNATADDLIGLLQSLYGRDIAVVQPDGALHRLDSLAKAHQELTRQGIAELVCGAPAASMLEGGRSWRSSARRVVLNPYAARLISKTKYVHDVPLNFVHQPAFEGRLRVNRLITEPNTTITVDVYLRNTSRFWWSSRFKRHPVTVSYRWLTPGGDRIDHGDGIRSLFVDPVGPGQRVEVPAMVRTPAEPGDYQLAITLVQEAFVWFDDVVPELSLRLPVAVR